MKYVYWTILCVAAVTLAILGYQTSREPSFHGDAGLVINGQAFSADEFERRFAASPLHPHDREGFVEQLVTQQLIIQEAQKLAIDKEESFRLSLQNFYEQSLVKTLMDRQYRSAENSASELEVARYQFFADKILRMTLTPTGTAGLPQSQTVPFLELPATLRQQLASLEPGSASPPFRLGDERVVVRLDGVEAVHGKNTEGTEWLRQLLREDKRARSMDEWLGALRDSATVEIRIPEQE